DPRCGRVRHPGAAAPEERYPRMAQSHRHRAGVQALSRRPEGAGNPTMKPVVLAAVALAALGLAACQQSGDDQASFDARVKAYLMKHPDDLKAALDNVQPKEDADQARQEADADNKARAALPALRAALERDPR